MLKYTYQINKVGDKMNIIDLSKGKRETYKIVMKYSMLLESALGIAAVTNEKLTNTLEKDMPLKGRAFKIQSQELKKELEYVSQHNTWKALLQLLHYCKGQDLESFKTFIDNLSEEKLKFYCIPYLGMGMQETRLSAAKGDLTALEKITELTKSNMFFPKYIDFIVRIDSSLLKKHLISVITKWFYEVILEEKESYEKILERDIVMKSAMLNKFQPEEFVKWATGGIDYVSEPSVTRVLLVPHYIYRPWNIEADFENTKVFYYPISNESIYPDDKLTPDNFLVLKFKALGDETRLKIMKILYEREQTLQDLALQLNIPKSSLHHHLSTLRSARLVTTNNGVYQINKWSTESLTDEFFNFLKN